MRRAGVFLAFALLSTGLYAQWREQRHASSPLQSMMPPMEGSVIQGRVVTNGTDASDLRVLLFDQSNAAPWSAQVSGNGSFTFSGVGHGFYRLSVVDTAGRSMCESSLSVNDLVTRVELTMPEQHRSGAAGGEAISVEELRHKPPKEALKEAERGESALRAGKLDKATGHFERALQIDPEFAAVRQELSKLYLQRRDDGRAVAHLEALLKQRVNSVWAWANLGAARLRLGRMPEAEAAARRTLALDANQIVGRYVLGISLTAQGRNTDEALSSLRATYGKFPGGHLAAAHILALRGDIPGAREELQAYLGTNPAGDTSSVYAWLARHPAE